MSETREHDPLVPSGLSKHRIEALTDGIYAVAMTLLVIELKVPDAHTIGSHDALIKALADLVPKFGSWLISFFVLATFWIGHHRLYQSVRIVDTPLLWMGLRHLALVSLLPFSASTMGAFGNASEALYIYNGNMILLSLTSLHQLIYVRRHPELQGQRLSTATYRAGLLRIGGLMAAGVIALVIAAFYQRLPVVAAYSYLIMWPVGIYSRRVAARDAAIPTPHTQS